MNHFPGSISSFHEIRSFSSGVSCGNAPENSSGLIVHVLNGKPTAETGKLLNPVISFPNDHW